MKSHNGKTSITSLPAAQALDAYFLEARAKLLDLAGILDRIGRGVDAAKVGNDTRLEKLNRALEILQDKSGGRAERIQQVFSLNYDAAWKKPAPK